VAKGSDLEAAVRNLRQALDTLVAGDDAIVHARDEVSLVQDMCRAIVEEGGYRFAWVAYAERDDERSVRRVAQWGASGRYPEAVKVTWGDGPTSVGPGGTAIRTGQPATIEDMLTDPRYAHWREQALEYGHRSGLAVPLRVRGEVIGFLGIYSELPSAFDEAATLQLCRLGEHLGFGIEGQRDVVRLAQSEALYRSLLEGLPGYVYTLHPDSLTQPAYVSPQVKEMLGYGPAELLAEPDAWRRVIHADDRDWVLAEFRAAVERSASFELEYRVLDSAGETRWVRDHAIRVGDGSGLWQGVVLDVTSSKQVAEESQNVAKFLAMTSHEIRTPLNSIIGFSQLLSDPSVGLLSEHQRRYVGNIASAGAQLLDLINDVLDLAKAKANRFDLQREPLEGRAALRAAADQLVSLATSAGVDILFLPGDPAPMVADARAVRQVLLNLLSNAIKFTPTGGALRLGASVGADGYVTMSVADTGRGIPAHDLDSVFDEYRQVGAQAGDGKGTGLGLALSRRLAELMSGTLTVESEVDVGSTFGLRVPGP
jgi:PAS domain S-box-containing protein